MAARTPHVPPIPIFPVPGIPIPGSIDLPGVGGAGIPNPFSGIGSALHGASEAEHLFAKLLDPHTYVRFGEVAVGGILLIAGLFTMLNKGNRVGKSTTTIVRTGANVVPAGKAANTASAASKASKAAPLTRK